MRPNSVRDDATELAVGDRSSPATASDVASELRAQRLERIATYAQGGYFDVDWSAGGVVFDTGPIFD